MTWWLWVILGYLVLGMVTVWWLKWRQLSHFRELKSLLGGRKPSWGEYWEECLSWTDVVWSVPIMVVWPLCVWAELGAEKTDV